MKYITTLLFLSSFTFFHLCAHDGYVRPYNEYEEEFAGLGKMDREMGKGYWREAVHRRAAHGFDYAGPPTDEELFAMQHYRMHDALAAEFDMPRPHGGGGMPYKVKGGGPYAAVDAMARSVLAQHSRDKKFDKELSDLRRQVEEAQSALARPGRARSAAAGRAPAPVARRRSPAPVRRSRPAGGSGAGTAVSRAAQLYQECLRRTVTARDKQQFFSLVYAGNAEAMAYLVKLAWCDRVVLSPGVVEELCVRAFELGTKILKKDELKTWKMDFLEGLVSHQEGALACRDHESFAIYLKCIQSKFSDEAAYKQLRGKAEGVNSRAKTYLALLYKSYKQQHWVSKSEGRRLFDAALRSREPLACAMQFARDCEDCLSSDEEGGSEEGASDDDCLDALVASTPRGGGYPRHRAPRPAPVAPAAAVVYNISGGTVVQGGQAAFYTAPPSGGAPEPGYMPQATPVITSPPSRAPRPRVRRPGSASATGRRIMVGDSEPVGPKDEFEARFLAAKRMVEAGKLDAQFYDCVAPFLDGSILAGNIPALSSLLKLDSVLKRNDEWLLSEELLDVVLLHMAELNAYISRTSLSDRAYSLVDKMRKLAPRDGQKQANIDAFRYCFDMLSDQSANKRADAQASWRTLQQSYARGNARAGVYLVAFSSLVMGEAGLEADTLERMKQSVLRMRDPVAMCLFGR